MTTSATPIAITVERNDMAGVDPVEAVKYQILIMFLIAGGTGLGVLAAVLGGVRRLTDGRHRLRLDRLTLTTGA